LPGWPLWHQAADSLGRRRESRGRWSVAGAVPARTRSVALRARLPSPPPRAGVRPETQPSRPSRADPAEPILGGPESGGTARVPRETQRLAVPKSVRCGRASKINWTPPPTSWATRRNGSHASTVVNADSLASTVRLVLAPAAGVDMRSLRSSHRNTPRLAGRERKGVLVASGAALSIRSWCRPRDGDCRALVLPLSVRPGVRLTGARWPATMPWTVLQAWVQSLAFVRRPEAGTVPRETRRRLKLAVRRSCDGTSILFPRQHMSSRGGGAVPGGRVSPVEICSVLGPGLRALDEVPAEVSLRQAFDRCRR